MTLNNERDAIKQAVEAGWHPTYLVLPHLHNIHCEAEILQDPAFWQALGKAREWDVMVPEWKRYAMTYFGTKLSGGDTSTFWQSLP